MRIEMRQEVFAAAAFAAVLGLLPCKMCDARTKAIIGYIDGCNAMAIEFGYQASDLSKTYIRIQDEDKMKKENGDIYSMVILVNFSNDDECHLAGFLTSNGKLDMIESDIPEHTAMRWGFGDEITYQEMKSMIK